VNQDLTCSWLEAVDLLQLMSEKGVRLRTSISLAFDDAEQ